ncbi:MAG: transglycosylase SLT domain-containing protein [Deltaproteobacteria bacterium]|nr:transglycosylase SLT domain-containing protein [Deltaproteobacteria bacterium]
MKPRELARRALAAATEGRLGSESGDLPKRSAQEAEEIRKKNLDWLAHPGIQGVGIGPRALGKQQKELTVKVYVERKLPLSKLSNPVLPDIKVPGVDTVVKTDVEAIGKLQLETTARVHRPVKPGTGIGLANPELGTGTLGCLVRKKGQPGEVFILSNSHVIGADGRAQPGTVILQPSGEHNGREPADVIARLAESVPFRFTEIGFFNFVDAAIARVESPNLVNAAVELVGLLEGGPTPVLRAGTEIQIVGAVSEHRVGQVKDPDFRCAFDLTTPTGAPRRAGFRQQVLCTDYSEPGDSGALVTNRNKIPVGLHFAGSLPGSEHEAVSVFNKIGHVTEALGIEIITAFNLNETAPATMADDRWIRALQGVTTLGASALTAKQDNLTDSSDTELRQTNWSHAMASADLGRVRDILDRLRTAAEEFSLPAALLAAVASRESRVGNALAPDGTGDFGHGFGIMQVDDRTPGRIVIKDGGPKGLKHIRQAAEILKQALEGVQVKHPGWEDTFVLQGAAVAYNAGLDTVQTKDIRQMDKGTTSDDYGGDVIARAQFYLDHL